MWALVGVLALVAWLPRLRRHGRDVAVPGPLPGAPARTGASVWRSPLAWQVTAFMGTQAIFFYLMVTWLPSIEVARGVSPVRAGWDLFLFQVTGIAGGLLVSLAMRGRRDHRLAGVGVSVGMARLDAGPAAAARARRALAGASPGSAAARRWSWR